MGRETKLLLALLATLAGVFVGVLSMKLLVPRPPAGTGPDVAFAGASTEPHELVEPPSFSGRRAASNAHISADAFASAPAHAPSAAAGAPIENAPAPTPLPLVEEQPRQGRPEPPAATASAFAAREPVADAVDVAPSAAAPELLEPPPAAMPAPPPRRDPFVTATSLDVPVGEPSGPAAQVAVATPVGPVFDPAVDPVVVTAASAPTYVAAAGDSWWNLAERAYGDGRLYRALYAWNRVINPRVSLAPGTPLEIPPKPRLEAAWPALMPASAAP